MPVQGPQASRVDPASSVYRVHDPVHPLPHGSIPLTTQRPQPTNQNSEYASLVDSLASQSDAMLHGLLSLGRSPVCHTNGKPANGTIMNRKPAASGSQTKLVYTLELYPTLYEELVSLFP